MPETVLNISIMFRADKKTSLSHLKIVVMTLANCIILYSPEPTWSLLMSLLLCIKINSICAQITNMVNGAIGSPSPQGPLTH